MTLPERGIGAHRGGPATRPENTLAAFRHAIALGAHQIEFDVRRCADGALVVIHDASVDRTTDGRGRVARMRLAELRALDAGGGERIPTLDEALAVMPRDVWINLQIKKREPIAVDVAKAVVEHDRVDQVFVACGNGAARDVKSWNPAIRVCNLVRQESREAYVAHAIASGSDFVQLHHERGAPEPQLVRRAKDAGLRVNYFCRPDADDVAPLFEAGVDFALVDDVAMALAQTARLGICPLRRDPAGGA